MPRRADIRSIMVIGSGPIVIGQACEFDYSGTQACKVLRREGFQVSLVNSNPATIMTDPQFADRTYIEPLDPASVLAVLERERPDALLPTLGGQTGLNVAVALAESGDLDRLGIRLIGASLEAIHRAEDRSGFKRTMLEAGLEVPRAEVANTLDEALALGDAIGYPVIVRPSFTLGGGGSGFAHSREELGDLARRSLEISPVGEILVEESIAGWKEFELEVMRDGDDNGVIICSIENVDPMGVHTGDSVTVAPVQTLTDVEYQRMRDAALRCIRAIGVETGGSNVQFAVHPRDGRMVLIEMNPRVSRSSALASKATGFPIAKIAALLAVGYRLDEIANDITGETPAAFEPTLDYVVVKIPRFAFEKFPGADPELTSTMKSVGEVMAIGRTFKEALGKAWRGLEKGGFDLGATAPGPLDAVATATEGRLLLVEAALLAGHTVDEVAAASSIDPWFVDQIAQVVEGASALRGRPLSTLSAGELRAAKRLGLSDPRIAELTDGDRCVGAAASRSARRGSRLQDRRHVRRRVRGAHAVPLLHVRRGDRGPSLVETARGDPGVGSEPDRAGHRVRLRVRARGVRVGGGRVRVGDGEQQPRDRLDRLRHVEPVVLRTRHRGGRARRLPRGAAGGRDRAVRRSDPAQVGAHARGGRVPRARHASRSDRPRRGSRQVRGAPRRAGHRRAAARRGADLAGSAGDRRPHRVPGRRPAVLRPGWTGDGDRLRRR